MLGVRDIYFYHTASSIMLCKLLEEHLQFRILSVAIYVNSVPGFAEVFLYFVIVEGVLFIEQKADRILLES
jgi:hypothetical protein